jgi:quinolinate synthase
LLEDLKRRRRAVILAHNYQLPEVQDLADFVGDSLEMAFRAVDLDADVIVVAGVRFMAEIVAAINPDRIVLHPEPNSRCPLADSVNVGLISDFRSRFKGVPVVVYVNSPIEVKAVADYFVTSSSILRLISKLNVENVIFGPDKNLADYISEKLNVNVIQLSPESHCPIYEYLLDEYYVLEALKYHPNAKLLVHPQVSKNVRRLAHFVGSDNGIVRAIGDLEGEEFLIGAEEGLAYRAGKLYGGKRIFPVNYRAVCIEMKKITPRKIIDCLENLKFRVTLAREVISKAREVIFSSLELLE